MQNKPKKYLNNTKQEIGGFLEKFKTLVKNRKFIITQNDKRMDNRQFIQKYHLNLKKQVQMLLEIQVTDFCYSIDNDKDSSERLYVFVKEYYLDNWGIVEKVAVYIKIVIKIEDYTVIISFHEPHKSIKKLFI